MSINIQIEPFSSSGSNLSQIWKTWKSKFQIYLKALKYHKEENDIQVALFLQVGGEEIRRRYESLEIKKDDETKLEDIIKSFDKYFEDYKNVTQASYVFWKMVQAPNESFDDFLTRIRIQSHECEFGVAEERNLKDKIIHGISDNKLRERLLRERKITLASVVENCKNAEIAKGHAESMQTHSNVPSSEEINVLKKNSTFHRNQVKSYPDPRQNKMDPIRRVVTCFNCGRPNHYASQCRDKRQPRRNLNVVDTPECDCEHETNECDSIASSPGPDYRLSELRIDSIQNGSKWFERGFINGNPTLLKLDTGSCVNAISIQEISKWNVIPKYHKCKTNVITYTKDTVDVLGECMMSCRINNIEKNLKFIVTNIDTYPILSAESCENFGLIVRVRKQNQSCINEVKHINLETELNKLMNEYQDIFDGIGKVQYEYKICIDESVKPHVAAPRKIPLSKEKQFKEQLMKMEENGIIKRVDRPTDWVNGVTLVEKKDGSLRICLDPRPLNKAIKRSHYEIPCVDNLFDKLVNSKIFSLFDVKSAYWHIPLDEDSSYLTTFITKYGRYRYCVMPFGLSCAAEAFQSTIDCIFSKHENINPYFDDIIIGSQNEQQHLNQIRELFQVARKENLKFNKDKIQIAVEKIKYLGHVLSSQGIAPDPEKIEAISKFPTPTCKLELQRFLGMATYLMKFVKNFASETFALRQLLKKDVDWLWDMNTEKEFQKLKNLLINAPVLQYFDINQPIVVSVDASSYGLGAMLIQNNGVVAYSSASLNELQRVRYAQIEKELLAVVYGLEKFHHFVYGNKITIHSDHKPLVNLIKKPYESMSPRLVRMLLRIQCYDIEILYVPGKELVVADALSRAPNVHEFVNTDDVDQSLPAICSLVNATPNKLEEVKEKTATDGGLIRLKQYIINGWPANKSHVDTDLREFWHCRDELHILDGCIMRGTRLVLPKECRAEALKKLHDGHFGLVSCKKRAREVMYWPSLNTDIENLVKSCLLCQKYSRANQNEPIVSRDIPNRPWSTLGMDFFKLNGKNYLLVIDYYSKYVELDVMHSMTALSVINHLQAMFARHGLPDEIVSDSGPPFDSVQFSQYLKESDIKHSPSSPRYPRSNGEAERAIQTIKNSLRKTLEEGKDMNTTLMNYRATPKYDLPSPAELLMGRKIRTGLPTHPSVLKPNHLPRNVSRTFINRKYVQEKYGNCKTKPLNDLPVGQKVWYKIDPNDKDWKVGMIIKADHKLRRYEIESSNSRVYIRNRVHIKPYVDSGVQQTSCMPCAHQSISVEDYGSEEDYGDLIFTSEPESQAEPFQPSVDDNPVQAEPPRSPSPISFDGDPVQGQDQYYFTPPDSPPHVPSPPPLPPPPVPMTSRPERVRRVPARLLDYDLY